MHAVYEEMYEIDYYDIHDLSSGGLCLHSPPRAFPRGKPVQGSKSEYAGELAYDLQTDRRETRTAGVVLVLNSTVALGAKIRGSTILYTIISSHLRQLHLALYTGMQHGHLWGTDMGWEDKWRERKNKE